MILRLMPFVITVVLAAGTVTSHAASPWGSNYFPNVALTTHDGRSVRFFDDLIKDKIVVINFIYTSCADVCPLETAQLTRVQRLLGDRLGKDIFFYSITIDPDKDTPDVLRAYRERFGANWAFLTGEEKDIVLLRRKLGLYIEDIQGDNNNHNISMIIGNQATGRWMKRSPFENPHVLADQIGNWLNGWKTPQEIKDYAEAPKLRAISDGEKLFRTRCQSCHTIDGSDDSRIGPDLLGVTQVRDHAWLFNWLRAPDKMLASGDPIATELYNRFNKIAMPNLGLSPVDVKDLINYMAGQSSPQPHSMHAGEHKQPHKYPAVAPEMADVVAIMNAWIGEALPGAPANAGYMTLVNPSAHDITMIGVESPAFGSIELHEMSMNNGMSHMKHIVDIVIPAAGQLRFEPGGKHLMLKQPSSPVVIDQQIELTLVFDTGRRQNVSVKVMSY